MRSIPPAAPPTGTYRLQINSAFTFSDAAQLCSYLRQLGVSHVYLSPILQPVPGSAHGYDVIDHAVLSADAGGRPAFDALVAAAHANGLKLIADVVPNHMAVPTPENLNAPLWSVLREGTSSPFASWFDIDWSPGQVLMPVLGDPAGTVVAAGQLTVDDAGDEPVLRYFDHVFPLREGTAHLPMPELLAAQHYRLAWWRIGSEELNYRRFFDVTTLAGIRVEDPEVFDVSHALLADLVHEGALDGLRIDHPDGLADPRGYLRSLARATGNVWVVVEKILEGDEELPPDWLCAGTTGYDALNVVGGLFVDPAAALALTRLSLPPHRVDDQRVRDLDDLASELELATRSAKQQVIESVLTAEVSRLLGLLTQICRASLDLRDHTRGSLHGALVMLLLEMDRYRAYAVPGEPAPAESADVIAAVAARARARLAGPQQQAALDAVAALALDTMSGDPLRNEFVVRFQQTCGPVMAKGIEDTLFYRWLPLVALNEVGADPHQFGYSVGQFHAYAAARLRDWPATMTTLSTHDTKRSEDARAPLYALTEVPDEWAAAVHTWTAAVRKLGLGHQVHQQIHHETAYLFWQTLVATWTAGPPDPERIVAYLQKASREAKLWTTWTDPDEEYESGVEALVRGVLADAGLVTSVGAFVSRLAPADHANLLGQKLIQLTMPGVPDVYQGCELTDRSLVDPDNRRPVDYGRRRSLLATADISDGLDAAKLLVTTRALSLRREHPDWFGPGSDYVPITSSSDHLVAFGRGTGGRVEAITLASRLALRLAAAGGWGNATTELPEGAWTDVLSGHEFAGGTTLLGQVFDALPVALLTRS